jgi:cytochrome P450
VHAANFDESVYESADRLDLDRPAGQPHVGFGHGPHACVGLQLARVQIDVAIRAVVRRFASMTPAEPDPGWKANRLLRGPKRLMVDWTLADQADEAGTAAAGRPQEMKHGRSHEDHD